MDENGEDIFRVSAFQLGKNQDWETRIIPEHHTLIGLKCSKSHLGIQDISFILWADKDSLGIQARERFEAQEKYLLTHVLRRRDKPYQLVFMNFAIVLCSLFFFQMAWLQFRRLDSVLLAILMYVGAECSTQME